MKRILFPAALALAFCSSFAIAQESAPAMSAPQQAPAPVVRQHRHAPDPQKAAAVLSRKLNLTPDQTAKLEPILADRDQKISALMANTDLDPKTKHKQIHAIHRDSEQQLAGILTPDQLQQMKSMHHGRHGAPTQPLTPPPAA